MKIDITPSLNIFNTYKNFSYNMSSALFEYFDNSTSSFFQNGTKKDKRYIITLVDRRDKDNAKLMIIDNAFGMNEEDFVRAIRIDNKQKMSERNKFGVGLKVSAIWFSDVWTIESLESGKNNYRKFTFDLNEIQNSTSPEFPAEVSKRNFIGDEFGLDFEQGTIITLNNPRDLPTNKNSVERLVKNIANQFTNDINKENVKFIISEIKENNNGSIEYTDLVTKYFGKEDERHIKQILTNSMPVPTKKVEWKKVNGFDVCEEINISVDDPKDNRVTYTITGVVGWISDSGVGKGGFKRLWKNRALEDKDWQPEQILGKPNGYVAQRMYGELDFSHFEPTNSKDGFIIDSDLEFEIIRVLQDELKELKSRINKTSKQEAKEKKSMKLKDIQKSFNKNAEIVFNNNEHLENKVLINDLEPDGKTYALISISNKNVKISTSLSSNFENDYLINPKKKDDANFEYHFEINSNHDLISQASEENIDNITRMIYLVCYSEVVARVKYYVENEFKSLSHIEHLNKKFYDKED